MAKTIKADGVAQVVGGDNLYHAWFSFGKGDYRWSAYGFETEAEAQEYGRRFVEDYKRITEAKNAEK